MNLIWKNPEEFRNATLGKRIDVDNFPKEQPYQCWDLPAFFWSRVVGRFLATKQGGGGAKDCWNYSRIYNAGSEFELITDRNALRVGDWLIDNGGEWGHVGMVTAIVAQGQVVRLLGQNQPYGYVNEINFSLRNFAGAFRLKAWNNSPSPAPNLNKSVEELAREVIAGKYGNGDARRNALGARFNEVQAKVNELLATPAPAPQQPAPRPSYIVQAGDTLGQIIVSQGWTNGRELWGPNGAVEQIARHNGIANANLISIGQRIERDY
jgi:phage protein|nr:MAG TPA: peptidoglycan hydrolase [Caudoviricetes sp.]